MLTNSQRGAQHGHFGTDRTKYQVAVFHYTTKERKDIGDPQSTLRAAERVENGVNINLDHDNWYSLIIELPGS